VFEDPHSGSYYLLDLDTDFILPQLPTSSGTRYRVRITDDLAGVSDRLVVGAVPVDYQLMQNYPNPFNAGTVIEFALPVPTHAVLEVYDILGRRVATLLDADLAVGRHRVEWRGVNQAGRAVASGVYLYRLRAGEIGLSRKLTLLK
jgi:hypothetical protein